MDKTRDVRRRHFNKRSPNFSSSAELSDGDVLSSEKTRKERFQRLSLVGRATSSFPDGEKLMEPSETSEREEERLRAVVGRKRFKLPRKFLEDCKSSVPRKLRSAMKKRSRESLSPPVLEPKKPKHSICGGESPKKDGAKKTKKKGKPESRFPGPITKDEEEVVETLSTLAGMFLNNNDACDCNRADEESSPADTSAAPGGTEASTNSACEAKEEELQISNPPEKSSEETAITRCLDGPITHQSPELLHCKLFRQEQDKASRAGIDLQTTPSQSWSEKRNEELHTSFGPGAQHCFDAHLNKPGTQDEEVVVTVNGNQLNLRHKIEDRKNNGPVLWPGLLTGSLTQEVRVPAELPTSKIPAWLNRATVSKNPRPLESGFATEKVPKSKVSKISWKRCMKHVFISHLIRSLQMPENEDSLTLQPNLGRKHEETERRVHAVGPNLNVLKNGLNRAFGSTMVSDSQRNPYEARSSILQQNRHSKGPKSSLSENEGFDFLSLSASVSGLHHKPNVPYLHSVTQQQHFSVPLSSSKNFYSNSYSDQFSGVTASRQVQQQLPSYLGNSGLPLLYRGLMAPPKEQQHQQMLWTGPIASAQFKSGGTLKQFPTWENGSVGSPTMVPFAAIIPPPPSSIEPLGPKHSQLSQQHHHHHYQQQQQLISLRSSIPPGLGKRQDNLPRSAQEQTVQRFHGGGALSLQLLCNERL